MMAHGRGDVAAKAFAQGLDDVAIGCELGQTSAAEMTFMDCAVGTVLARSALAAAAAAIFILGALQFDARLARGAAPFALREPAAIQPAIMPKKMPQKNSAQSGMSMAAKGASRENGSKETSIHCRLATRRR